MEELEEEGADAGAEELIVRVCAAQSLCARLVALRYTLRIIHSNTLCVWE